MMCKKCEGTGCMIEMPCAYCKGLGEVDES